MGAIRELLRLIRVMQCEMSVRYYLNDIERSRWGLQKAIEARDVAMAALQIHDSEIASSIPVSLYKQPEIETCSPLKKASLSRLPRQCLV